MCSFLFLVIFFVVYRLNFFYIIMFLKNFVKLFSLFSNSLLSSGGSNSFILLIVSFSGLPPFPIFFLKLYVVFSLYLLGRLNYFLLFFLFTNVILLVSYIQVIIYMFVNKYTSVVSYCLV